MQLVASLLTYGFIAWLLIRDLRTSVGVSKALWIPIFWVIILGSRPVSMWLDPGENYGVMDNVDDIGALNRNVFLGLLIAGIVVLTKRQFSWPIFMARNKWLCAFFLYFAISTIWSDAPFISLKRWTKDFGNVVMVLVVLTEENPTVAMKKLFVRAAYILMPLSVLYIKYYPNIGRYFNTITWQYSYGGVTRDKNELGASLIIYGIFVVWDYFSVKDGEEEKNKFSAPLLIVLLAMNFWLLRQAHSSTSMVCTMVGILLFCAMRRPNLRFMVARLAIFLCGGALLLVFLQVKYKIGGFVLELLGRDLTFTGRTEIWDRLMDVKINPLIGVGFYSFWMGSRVEEVSDGFYFHLNEAHDGYLETYLDGGLIGLFLLIVLLFSCFRRLSRRAVSGRSVDSIGLIFIVINLIYNITEAHFSRQSVIWVVFLLVAIDYPKEEMPLFEYADDEEEEASEESLHSEPPSPAY